jgi:hypothetical protein
VLAIAHTLTADLICSGCGHPKHEAYNPDSDAWYTVRDAECNGCRAVAKDADIHKDPQPERKVWVVDERPPNVKLRPWKPN